MAFLDNVKKFDYKIVTYVLGGIVALALAFYGYTVWVESQERKLSLRIDELLLQEKSLAEKISESRDGEAGSEIDPEVATLIGNLKAIYEANPSRINGTRALFSAANLEMQSGAYEAARAGFTTIADNHPDHFLAPRALFSLILLDEAEELPNEALIKVEDFNKRYPNSYLGSEINLTQGRLHLQLREYDLAKTYFDEAIINGKGNRLIENAQEKIDYLRIKGFITNQ